LKAAHDDLNAKRYEDAISKLKEVEALPHRTPFDTHIMNELFGFAYVRTNNYVEAAKYLEPGATDGFLKPQDLNLRIKALAQVNYQVRNYEKAIEFGNRAIVAEPTDTLMHTLVAQAYYLNGDWRGASRFEEQILSSQIQTGGAPAETSLQLLLSACLKLRDTACEMRALDSLVTYYPKIGYQRELDRLRVAQ
jgi:tetratricopeptide (TPR) repeat protein